MKRFPKQNMILHDKNRSLAFLYNCQNKNDYEIILVPENLEVNSFSQEEQQFQKLWKTFFKTISIKERTNYRLQMQYMPKKYWKDLIEMQQIICYTYVILFESEVKIRSALQLAILHYIKGGYSNGKRRTVETCQWE